MLESLLYWIEFLKGLKVMKVLSNEKEGIIIMANLFYANLKRDQ